MFETIVALTVIGSLLIFVELFVPGLVAGICGALALVAAVVLTYAEYGSGTGNWMLAAVLLASLGLFVWWMRAFPNTRFARRWTLQEEVPAPPAAQQFQLLAGCTGRTITPLRLSGTALIAERRVDVVAESDAIDADVAIRVVRIEGAKVVVRAVP